MASVPVYRASSAASATGTASTAALTIPAGVDIGDMMVAVVGYKLATGSGLINTPAGWTQLAAPQNGPSGATMQGAVLYKIAVSGDPGSVVTFNASAGSQQINVAFAAYDLAGATPRSFSWVTSTTTAGTTVPHAVPTTAAQAGDLIIVAAAIRGSVNGAAPVYTGTSGVTVRASSNNISGSAQNVGAYIGDADDVSAIKNVTADSAVWYVAGQVVLAPGTVAFSRDVAEAVTAGDGTARAAGLARAAGEAVVLGNAVAPVRALGRAPGEVLSAVESHARTLARLVAVAQSLALADASSRTTGRTRALGEALAAADVFGSALVRGRVTGESVAAADVPVRTVARAGAAAETVTVADASGRTSARARGAAEALVLGNTAVAGRALVAAAVNTLVSSDAWTYTLTRSIGMANAIAVADAVARATAWSARGVGELFGFSDVLVTGLGVIIGLPQTLVLGNAVGRGLNRPATASNTVVVEDVPAGRVAAGRAAAESLAAGDVQQVGRVVLSAVGQTLVLGDGLSRAVLGYGRSVPQPLTVADTVGRVAARARGAGESLVLGNTVVRLVDRARGMAEPVVVGQVLAGGRFLFSGFTQPVALGDVFGRARSGGRAAPGALVLADDFLASRRIIPVSAAHEVAFSDIGQIRTARARATEVSTLVLVDAGGRQIDRARQPAEPVTFGQVVAVARGQVAAAPAGLVAGDSVVVAADRRAGTFDTVLVFDFVLSGDYGGQLVIAHFHQTKMTGPPKGRIRMTGPPRGSARRTV